MTTTILVVEDEPAILELVAVNLRHAGFQVVRATSAEEGETVIRHELPDLLVLDWMLPGQSGVGLARKLRADERTRELPIIMLTARVTKKTRFRGWRRAPTTTSPSRFRRKSWWPASVPCCGGGRRTWPGKPLRSAP